MKRKMLMLLMSVLMMLGMTQVAMADDVKYYEGSGRIWIRSDELYTHEGEIQVSAIVREGHVEGSFEAGNGDTIGFWSELNADWFMSVDENSPIKTTINGRLVDHLSGGCRQEGNDIFWGTKGGIWSSEADYLIREYYFEFSLTEVEMPAEPEIYYIKSGFSANGVSDSGVYELYIAGYFTQELTDGVYSLTSAEINAQTIAIVAYNNTNGVKRVMRENTIEEITVTVLRGVVIEANFRGRVQTDGGTLDRYTAALQ